MHRARLWLSRSMLRPGLTSWSLCAAHKACFSCLEFPALPPLVDVLTPWWLVLSPRVSLSVGGMQNRPSLSCRKLS